MPTRIDLAAEAAHEAIADAVEQIENNLLESASHPSPRASDDDDEKSPLFRDEVQRQEMRYLDGLLLGKKPSVGGSEKKSQNRGCNRLSSPRRSPPRSRIATILGPYERRDEDDRDENEYPSRAQNNDEQQSVHMKQPTPNRHGKSPGRVMNQQTDETISGKIRGRITNLIHRSSSQPKQNSKRSYNQKRARAAAPSRNKRHQLNNKLLQRAQSTSRRLVAKMVRLGRRCTRNLTTIKSAISVSVARAVANAHSMLDEAASSTMSGVHHTASSGHGALNPLAANKAAETDGVDARGGGESEVGAAEGIESNSSVPAPPGAAFAMAPQWVLGDARYVSSKAASIVQKVAAMNKK